jgi:hypothetical protein
MPLKTARPDVGLGAAARVYAPVRRPLSATEKRDEVAAFIKKLTGPRPVRHYAVVAGLISGGLSMIGIAQGLRLLLLLVGNPLIAH